MSKPETAQKALTTALINKDVAAVKRLVQAYSPKEIIACANRMVSELSSNFEILEIIFRKEKILTQRDEAGLGLLDYMALRLAVEEDEAKKEQLKLLYREGLKKTDADEEEITQAIDLSLAKFMLPHLYGEASPNISDKKLIPRIFLKKLDSLDLKDKENFRAILEIILSDKPFPHFAGGTILKMMPAQLENHVSYFVIEHDSAKPYAPRFVYYVDGNCPLAADQKQ